MYIRPRRLTPGQTRTFGLALIVIGAFLVWDVVVDARLHVSYTMRWALLAPSALLVRCRNRHSGTAWSRSCSAPVASPGA